MTVAGCSRSGPVLDCGAAARPAIRDILAIHVNSETAENLTLIPTRVGTLEVTGGEYTIHFVNFSDRYELRFRINRATSDGTRQLVDTLSGKTVAQSFDTIFCKPYHGKKFKR